MLQFLGFQHRSSRKIYVEAIPQVEKWCSLTNQIFMKLFAPSLILLQVFYSLFYVYSTANEGNDALEMIYPFW